MPNASSKKITEVWINGRFLTRNISGVERVALCICDALSENFLSSDGLLRTTDMTLSFRIAVPYSQRNLVPAFVGRIPVVAFGKHDGHLWEQLDLVKLPSQAWLLNLCNTGPLFRELQGFFLHDAQVYGVPENFTLKFRFWYRVMFNIAGRRAAFLLTNSEFSANELSHHTGIERGRFSVAHLGSDHAGVKASQLDGKLLQKIPAGQFVLAVSSANPNKNFRGIVEALSLMGESAPACVIVGQLNPKVFSRAGFDSSKVTHLGRVSDETLLNLYRRALCLVYPSFYEGFGLPPVEAMRCGCPVIVSSTSSLPEVCGDAALYCDPQQPRTLANAIKRLMTDPKLVSDMRARGIHQATQYTWKSTTQKLVNCLLESVRLDVIKSEKTQGPKG